MSPKLISSKKGRLINNSFVNSKKTIPEKRVVISKSKINFLETDPKKLNFQLYKSNPLRLRAFFTAQGITKENFNSSFLEKIIENNKRNYKLEKEKYDNWFKTRKTAVAHTEDYHPKIRIDIKTFLNIGDSLRLSTREIINAHSRYVSSYDPRIRASQKVYSFLISLDAKEQNRRPDLLKSIIQEHGIKEGFFGLSEYRRTIKLLQVREETKQHNLANIPENLVDKITLETLFEIENMGFTAKEIIRELKPYSGVYGSIASKAITEYIKRKK
ncbi:MAG TPA: hypothetical protein PLK55_04450 [archaeon]|jgi:hypothetical protein|nr:hypothetical protein [archaeon]